MPLVRVVIPTYNRAALVAEALESVLAQTFFDYEVVVADDGSTDDTVSVVKRFLAKDARVRFLALSNGGAAKARNAAIKAPGSCRYVAFLDSDDLWLPYHLEKAIAILERELTVGLFCGGYERHDLTQSQIEPGNQILDGIRNPKRYASRFLGNGLCFINANDCVRAMLHSQIALHTSTVVVRYDAVKRADWFNRDLEIYEDLEFFLRLALDGSNLAYDDVIHCYRRRFGDNLTGSTDLSSPNVRRRYRSVTEYCKMKLSVCQCPEDMKVVSREIASAFYIIGECSREQGDLQAARAAYCESLRYGFSYGALRGLSFSSLPHYAYFALRNVKAYFKDAVRNRQTTIRADVR